MSLWRLSQPSHIWGIRHKVIFKRYICPFVSDQFTLKDTNTSLDFPEKITPKY